jgi:transposase
MIDGLAILARDVIQQDPLAGAMFAFINARRNKLKILVWERNILWYKRLERHRFHRPRVGDAVLMLSGAELNRLLDGYDVWMKPHEAPPPFRARAKGVALRRHRSRRHREREPVLHRRDREGQWCRAACVLDAPVRAAAVPKHRR